MVCIVVFDVETAPETIKLAILEQLELKFFFGPQPPENFLVFYENQNAIYVFFSNQLRKL